jgi:hypothetical protein
MKAGFHDIKPRSGVFNAKTPKPRIAKTVGQPRFVPWSIRVLAYAEKSNLRSKVTRNSMVSAIAFIAKRSKCRNSSTGALGLTSVVFGIPILGERAISTQRPQCDQRHAKTLQYHRRLGRRGRTLLLWHLRQYFVHSGPKGMSLLSPLLNRSLASSSSRFHHLIQELISSSRKPKCIASAPRIGVLIWKGP